MLCDIHKLFGVCVHLSLVLGISAVVIIEYISFVNRHLQEIAVVQAQLEIFRDSESQLILDLSERKEDYNRVRTRYCLKTKPLNEDK